MTRIDIALGPIEIDGPMASAAERYLSVTASLRIVVGGVTVLDEPAVPIVELASQLERTEVEDGFIYTSVESDYALLVVLPWRNGMYIASPMAGTCAEKPVTRDTVREAVKELRHALDHLLTARHIHRAIRSVGRTRSSEPRVAYWYDSGRAIHASTWRARSASVIA